MIPDQFFDRTRDRVSTFFGDGARGARRVRAPGLRRALRAWRTTRRSRSARACTAAAPTCAWKGRSSRTLAESRLYRSWGVDVIGMTNLQEAKLAREAEICYATLALVTDYDCWHPEHDSVTVEMIVGNLLANAKTAQAIIAETDRTTARGANVLVPDCPGHGDHHEPGRDPGADQAGSRADHREIHQVTCSGWWLVD